MRKLLSPFLLAIALLAAMPALACDKSLPCSQCAQQPEFAWTPKDPHVTPRLQRFYALGDLMTAAYKANSFDKAASLANEYLALADVYRCNWNYGNAIHNANRVLGLISLKDDGDESAALYLVRAGKSPGSPQLDSLGPELDLAHKLLQRDRTNAVKSYLRGIQAFWKTDDGRINKWMVEIDQGGHPDLDKRVGINLPTPVVWGVVLLLAVWPLLVTGVVLRRRKKRIANRPLFVVVNVVAGYAANGAWAWVVTHGVDALKGGAEVLNPTVGVAIVAVMVGMMFLLPLVTVMVLLRSFERDVFH